MLKLRRPPCFSQLSAAQRASSAAPGGPMACSASREAEAGRVSASRAGGHAPRTGERVARKSASRACFCVTSDLSSFSIFGPDSALPKFCNCPQARSEPGLDRLHLEVLANYRLEAHDLTPRQHCHREVRAPIHGLAVASRLWSAKQTRPMPVSSHILGVPCPPCSFLDRHHNLEHGGPQGQ